MVHKRARIAFSFILVSAAFLYLSGCNNDSLSPSAKSDMEDKNTASNDSTLKKTAETKAEDHAHQQGAHDGIIVEIGRDNYHAEAVFEKGGVVKLYTLGKDEAKVVDVEKQELTAYVKEEGSSDSQEIVFYPVPRVGDQEGRTSQFSGKLSKELAGKQVFITIPSITINGERFRLGFASAAPKHDEGMPASISVDDEKDLYLKPGGIYTEADIKANGTMTPAQKFKGLTSRHDAKPALGDKICPISGTKANPKFIWNVGGKSYAFCCPPCIDEFVGWAKTQPDLVKAPQEYVKKK